MRKSWHSFRNEYQKHIDTLKTNRRTSDLIKLEVFLKEKNRIPFVANGNKIDFERLKGDYLNWDNKKVLNGAEKSIFNALRRYLKDT